MQEDIMENEIDDFFGGFDYREENKKATDSNQLITPWFGCGGLMPNPPENCSRKDKHTLGKDGILFIDNTYCCGCSMLKKCERKIEYKQELIEFYELNKKLKIVEGCKFK